MRQLCWSTLVLPVLIAACAAPAREGGSEVLQWGAVTHRANGETLDTSDLDRYEVERRACDGSSTSIQTIPGEKTRMNIDWDASNSGCLELRVRAVDQEGITGAWSEPVRAQR